LKPIKTKLQLTLLAREVVATQQGKNPGKRLDGGCWQATKVLGY